MQRTVTYFEEKGKHNSEQCLALCKGLLKEGYKDFVVASTTGATGLIFGRNMWQRPFAEGLETTARIKALMRGIV